MQAAITTLFSGAVGGLTMALLCKPTRRSWRAANTLSKVVSGVLSGLVVSSATCAIAPVWAHAVTAALSAGTTKLFAKWLIRLGIDDVSSVVSVHLVGGVISVLAVGFFAQPDLLQQLPQLPSQKAAQFSAGFVYGGDGRQLVLQLVWLLLLLLWAAVTTVPLCLMLRSLGYLRNDTRSSLKGAKPRRCLACCA